MALSDTSLTMAGILFIALVTVQTGGAAALRIARGRQPATDIQRRFTRAGHGHAGMFLTVALVSQPFVDAADLDGVIEWVARTGFAIAAILIPAAFFLSVVKPGATEPNRLMLLLPAGVVFLTAGALTLGIGLLTV